MRNLALPDNYSAVYALVEELLAISDISARSQHYQTQKAANPKLIKGTASAWMFALDILCKPEQIKNLYQILQNDSDNIFSFSGVLAEDAQMFWCYLAETNQKEVLLNTFKKEIINIFPKYPYACQFTYAFRAFPSSFYKTLYAILEEPLLREPDEGPQIDIITAIFDAENWSNSREESEKKLELCSLLRNQMRPIERGVSLAELINSLWDSDFPSPKNLDEVILQLIESFFDKTTQYNEDLCDFLNTLDDNKLKFVVSKITPQLYKIFENKGLKILFHPEYGVVNGLKIVCKALAKMKDASIVGLDILNQKLNETSDDIDEESDSYREIYTLAAQVKFSLSVEKLLSEVSLSEVSLKVDRKRNFFCEVEENPHKKQKIESLSNDGPSI